MYMSARMLNWKSEMYERVSALWFVLSFISLQETFSSAKLCGSDKQCVVNSAPWLSGRKQSNQYIINHQFSVAKPDVDKH